MESQLSTPKKWVCFLTTDGGTQTGNEKTTSERIVRFKETLPTPSKKKRVKTGFGNVVGVTETQLNRDK